MRSMPVAIGALCGATLALGGIVLADLSSEPAEAQSSDRFVTQSEFEATDRANQRRIAAARRSAVNNFNLLRKYVAPLNEVIGVDVPEGVIR